MKSFCRKNEDYLNILKEKVQESPEGSPYKGAAPDSKPEQLNVEEEFRKQSTKLTLVDLEREILNIKIVLSSIFFANLASIEPKEVRKHTDEG